MSLTLAVIISLFLQGVAGGPAGVELRATVTPDSVRLGERITLTLTLAGAAGDADVVFPLFADTGAVIALAPPAQSSDQGRHSAHYELAAWELGELRLPPSEVKLLTDAAELRIPLPDLTVHVLPVLPAATELDSLAWKPPADVVGPNWSTAEKLAVLGTLIAIALAAFRYARRRRVVQPVPGLPTKSPRTRALEALDRLETSGLLDAGELKAFYSALAGVLREFLAYNDQAWGLDLTTTELMGRVWEDGVPDAQARTLSGLLDGADLVKFARRRPSRAQAARALDAARIWLVEFVRLPRPAPLAAVEAPVGGADEAAGEPEASDPTDLDDLFAPDADGDEGPAEAEAEIP